MEQTHFPLLEDPTFAKQLPVKAFVGHDLIGYDQLKVYIGELIAAKRYSPLFRGHAEGLEHLLLDLEADHMVYEARQK